MSLLNKYQEIKNNPRAGGYSDIRMWPCYVALCLSTLFFAQWLGLFWSFTVIGLPVFAISLLAVGIHKPEKAPIKSWKMYEAIEQKNREFERSNYLLRRNMKIIQEDERIVRQLKKADRVHRNARSA